MSSSPEDSPKSTPANGVIKSFVTRAERLIDERKAADEALSDLWREAKGARFDVRAMKAYVARRARSTGARQEFEATVDLYARAVEEADA